MFAFRLFLVLSVLTLSIKPLNCMVHNNSTDFATEQLFNCASTGKDSDLIDTFIEHGGNVLATDCFGRTPLEIALKQQAYWNHQAAGLRFEKRELQKHSRNFLTTVKKLRNAELQAKRTLTAKNNKAFELLCACAVIEKKSILKEEAQPSEILTQEASQRKRSTLVKKSTFAEKLLSHKALQHSPSTLPSEESEAFIKKNTREADPQGAFLIANSEEVSSKKNFSNPLKKRVHLTITIPKKITVTPNYLQEH